MYKQQQLKKVTDKYVSADLSGLIQSFVLGVKPISLDDLSDLELPMDLWYYLSGEDSEQWTYINFFSSTEGIFVPNVPKKTKYGEHI